MNDEVGGVRGPHLQPRAAASADVDRVGPLGHHTLQPEVHDVVVHRFALLGDVVRVAQRTGGRQDLPQDRLALEQWQSPQVVSLEGQQVERVVRRGQRDAGHRDVARALQPAALLNQLKARDPVGPVHHDLSVDQRGGVGQLCQHLRDLRKDRGEVVAVP